jgi:hypothetical protein
MTARPASPPRERRPIEADHPRPAPPAPARRRSRYLYALLAAVALGVAVRAYLVLSEPFPLNDGGLFYVMIEDLRHSGYRLPAFTSYNSANIPYGYAPLGFYVAAALADLTPLGVIDLLRLLPLAVSCLMLVAFVQLARELLDSRAAVLAATAAFALVPRSSTWMLMGGGLTRSFGLLFAMLALREAYMLYSRRDARRILSCALFAGLTVLSHLGTAPFLAFSIVLFFLARGRSWHGVLSSLVVAAGATLVSAPWWLTVVSRHGFAPFLAAGATGGSVFDGPSARYQHLIELMRFGVGSTMEPLFPFIMVLGVLGGIVMVLRGRPLLPIWWVAILLLDHRAGATYTTIPIALLAGVGITRLLLPALARAWSSSAWYRPLDAGVGRLRALAWRSGPPALVLLALLLYCGFAAVTRNADLPGSEGPVLRGLTSDERQAMRWAARAAPPDSRFLVVDGWTWANDRWGEWFPVLGARVAVATVQGSEWLPNGEFERRVENHERLRSCANAGTSCLERWSRRSGTPFTHVYVPTTQDVPCCKALIDSLRASPGYVLSYPGPGAVIFERRNVAATSAADSTP